MRLQKESHLSHQVGFLFLRYENDTCNTGGKIKKRSEINKALKELEAMCKTHCCYLPPFWHFTPEQWQEIGHEYDEVRDCMLGEVSQCNDDNTDNRFNPPAGRFPTIEEDESSYRLLSHK